MDYELLGLSILLIISGVYFMLNNKFWKLDITDLKKNIELSLFLSGIMALILGISVFFYTISGGN
ncbi:hypothetical protein [Empedobacter falsenii]|uniref:hypothetical protein n=1 Tax=Empedobacter falsenii TaxID=343874 RepID=UPI001C597C67|nr:hypothetical protein [Empedobacter falsenii]MBW1619817.1 hypothetical protein [Empedobacter falsenii]